MPIYAREGASHVWLVDPIAKTLEVFLLDAAARWVLLGTWRDDAKVSVDPFAAVELELAALWAR
jgi:Uma2 family endonuclease